MVATQRGVDPNFRASPPVVRDGVVAGTQSTDEPGQRLAPAWAVETERGGRAPWKQP